MYALRADSYNTKKNPEKHTHTNTHTHTRAHTLGMQGGALVSVGIGNEKQD
jgi:2-iminoacetate synthase ThiH